LNGLAVNENKCILVSSHDLDLLLRYCQKIMVFDGQGVRLMAAAEAKDDSAFKILTGGFL
jgi:ABC-type cobalamin/Fe3+-siderophores transport system ATPase subunit